MANADKNFTIGLELEGEAAFAGKVRKAADDANAAWAKAGGGLASRPDLEGSIMGPGAEKRIERIAAAKAKLARQERAAAIAQLGPAEQLNSLLKQRERITGRLVEAEGNRYRTAVLNLGAARLDQAIGIARGRVVPPVLPGPEPEKPGIFGGSNGYLLRRAMLNEIGVTGVGGRIGARVLGGLGDSAIGGVATGVIGIAALTAGLAIGMYKAAEGLREARKESERLGVSLDIYRKLSSAAGRQTAEAANAFEALSKLRVQALAGDQGAVDKLRGAGLSPNASTMQNLIDLSKRAGSGAIPGPQVASLVGGENVNAISHGLGQSLERLGDSVDQSSKALMLMTDTIGGMIDRLTGRRGIQSFTEQLFGQGLLEQFLKIRYAVGIAQNPDAQSGKYGNNFAADLDVLTGGWSTKLAKKIGQAMDGAMNEAMGNQGPSAADQNEMELYAALAERADKADKLRIQNSEREHQEALGLLSPYARLNELIKERNRLLATPITGNTLQAEQIRSQVLGLNEQIRGLVGQGGRPQLQAGDAASMGLYRSILPQVLARTPSSQESLLRDIATNTKQTADAVKPQRNGNQTFPPHL